MIKIWQKWSVMIDVNNVCGHNCIYCPKHIRHLRKDQIMQMTEEEIINAIKSLEGWPGKIGFTGGEPLNYPDFPRLCEIARDMIPKEKAIIFTSHEKKLTQYKDIIDHTFSEVYINLHTKEQKEVCLHHPLLLAVGDMAPDEATMKTLIENCWCNKMWSPIIGKKGAFFCDCALGIDTALDMEGGWPVEPGWWKRDDYSDQMERYCHLCGMCLPYPGQKLSDGEELISYGLYEKFKKHNLRNIENMRIVKDRLTLGEIKKNLNGWEPWHNRQDRGYEGPAYVNESKHGIKLAIVSAWYNEELLAPLFLKHYDYVDEIHIILDTATNDRTREILAKDKRVVIHEMIYPPDGLDWTLKQAKVDEVYASINADWVFAIDADEFLFKKGEKDIKGFLARQTGEIMWAKLWQVYRHETDKDIDYTKPPVPQRRHGIPMEPETIPYYSPDKTYLKPIIVKGGRKPVWDCGCHVYSGSLIECGDLMDGAHWHMADPVIAVRRRLQTKARQGKKNLQLGFGIQNHFVTRDSILYECWLHRMDPVVIYTGFEDEEQDIISGLTPIERWRNFTYFGMEDNLQGIDRLFEAYKNMDTERFITEAYKLFPEQAIYINRIAEHLISQGKYDNALKLLVDGLKYNPNYGEIWCNLGYIYYVMGKYEEAEKYTEQALEIESDNETYKENLEMIIKAANKAQGHESKEFNDKSCLTD